MSGEPTGEIPKGPISESGEAAGHVNYAGYAKLVGNVVNVADIEMNYLSVLTPKEQKEGEKRMLEFFEDREKADKFIGGFKKAMDRLSPRRRRLLSLYYGLDNPENKGRSFKKVGELEPDSISGTRVSYLVRAAERTLRSPEYSVYYQNLLPR